MTTWREAPRPWGGGGPVERVVQPVRSPGGQRRYTRAEVGLVQQVSTMAGEGMSLAGIRRILELEAVVADLEQQMETLRGAAPE
jgi:MerR family transcriptional regulator/heat shock protein HspR